MRPALLLLCFILLGKMAGQSPPGLFLYPLPRVGNLPPVGVSALYEDPAGFLWLGTPFGLIKWDGVESSFFAYDPANPHSITFGGVYLLAGARQGGIWVGTNKGGLSLLDPRTEKAVTLRGMGGESVVSLYENHQGDLWVGTDHFALNYRPAGDTAFQIIHPPLPDNGEWTYQSAGQVGEIVPDPADSTVLWIGSRFGPFRFNTQNQTFQVYPFERPLVDWYTARELRMYASPDGRLWIGGYQAGLRCLDTRSGKWVSLPGNLPPDLSATVIAPYRGGLLLFTLNREFWWYQPQTGQCQSYLSPPGGINRALRTRHDQWWLGGNDQFAYLSDREEPIPLFNFSQYLPPPVLNNWQRAYALSADSSELYMGTLRGHGLVVWNWRQNTWRTLSLRREHTLEQTDPLIDALCRDPSGKWWVGSDEGLLTIAADGKRMEPVAFPGKHIKSLAWRDGFLWVGTNGEGLFRYDPAQRQTQAIPLHGNTINVLSVDASGSLWVGHEGGVTSFGAGDTSFWELDHQVMDLEWTGRDSLWIGSLGGGLSLLAGGQLHHFPNRETLGGEIIYDLAPTRRGRIWLHCESGFAAFDPRTRTFTNYDWKLGLFAKIGTLIELPNGYLVSGANRSFHYFHPDSLLNEYPAPRPYLFEFRVFDQVRDPEEGEPVILRYADSHFSVQVSALNTTLFARNTYAYRLIGYDRDWVYSGQRSYISYTGLPPGNYTLLVKAANQFGRWSEEVQLLELRILPPFWQKWWFVALILFVLAGIGRAVYRYFSVKQQLLQMDKHLAEAQLAALRAQMNPHFLFNSLNSINWYILKNKPREASRYLTKFSRLIRLILDHSKNLTVSLSEELEALRLYLDLESIRFEQHFQYEIITQPGLEVEEIQLPPLILQPYVENAIWHGLMHSAVPGRLEIEVRREGDLLVCRIEDNGIGRVAAEKLKQESVAPRESKGMRLTAQRIAMAGAVPVEITDLYHPDGTPAGTRVVVKVKM